MTNPFEHRPITRRKLMRYGGAVAAGVAGTSPLMRAASALATRTRMPDSLPNPRVPAGTVNEALPFDHIVVVMMENHSFDNLLGALTARAAEGRRVEVQRQGRGAQREPGRGRRTCTRSRSQPHRRRGVPDVERDPRADRRRADGRLRRSVENDEPMGYWTEDVLPFSYSFARTFTLANRWFCSAPCQTYPNRRFLMAGHRLRRHLHRHRKPARTRRRRTGRSSTVCTPTASAGRTTSSTCHRRRSSRRSSRDTRRTSHLSRSSSIDCTAGTLPRSASWTPSSACCRTSARRWRAPRLSTDRAQARNNRRRRGEPAGHVLRRVLGPPDRRGGAQSPAWPRTLLIYTYDEHGGYYDHVPPPAGDRARFDPTRTRPRRRTGRL